MSLDREQICRFCLKETEQKCNDVDETVRLTFDILSLKLDLDITRHPIICQDCLETAKIYLNFKYTCVNTERIILSFTVATRKTKHDIKVICKEMEDAKEAVNEDFNICRFCMALLRRDDCISLDVLMDNSIFDILPEYLPEMDFDIIENPTVCTTCRKTLQGYFQFVMGCLNIEAKIKSYCREESGDNTYQIELGNLVHFLTKDSLESADKSPQILNLKQESNRTFKCMLGTYEGKQKIHRTRRTFTHTNVSEIKMSRCSLCTYETKYKGDFDRYMLVHENDTGNMHKCPLCVYESKNKRGVKTHMLVHKDISEITMYKCYLCPYEAKQRKNLVRHIMSVHKKVSEKPNKTFKCSFCTYVGKQKHHLTLHMFIHKDVSEIEMYKCSLCGYETKNKGGLKRHTLVHKNVTRINMHKCPLCVYESKNKRGVKTHMLVHKDISEITMYKCYLCTYQAKQKKHLIRHMLIHRK